MQNPQTSLSIASLIWEAGWVVKSVMFSLFLASIACWVIILYKRSLLNQAAKQNLQFLQGFWGGWNLSEAFTRAGDFPQSPAAKSFQAAIRELRKFGEEDSNKHLRADIILRTLRKANMAEISQLESSLSFLATTASSAPFVGLFGTVWGIMNSFQNIGATGTANLAAVAPGISEALIATAIGLAAAIPAAIAYNLLTSKVRSQAVSLDGFNQDLLNLLQREGAI